MSSFGYFTRIDGRLMEFATEEEAYEYRKEHSDSDQTMQSAQLGSKEITTEK